MWLKLADTSKIIPFLMIDSVDHISGKTGLTVTVTLSKNGAAFAVAAGTVAEIANGWYKLTPTVADTGTLGALQLHATATGADPTDEEQTVVAFDPYDAVRGGLAALPNAAAGATGGLPTGNASGQVTVASLAAGAVTEVAAGVRTNLTTELVRIDAAITSRLAAATDPTAALAAISAYIDTEVAAIKAKTDNLPASPAAVGSAMILDLTQAIPATNTAQTVGDALNGARAQAFGKWVLVGTALTLYAGNGTTVVRTFTLDNANAPTSRS